jgi:hypothetical protein
MMKEINRTSGSGDVLVCCPPGSRPGVKMARPDGTSNVDLPVDGKKPYHVSSSSSICHAFMHAQCLENSAREKKH